MYRSTERETAGRISAKRDSPESRSTEIARKGRGAEKATTERACAANPRSNKEGSTDLTEVDQSK